MNIAEMLRQRNNPAGNMSLRAVQDGFKNLSETQLNEAVELARRQGISEQQINEGLRMISSLKNNC